MSAVAIPPEIFMISSLIKYVLQVANTEQEEEHQQEDADRQHRRSAGLPSEPRLEDRRMPLNRYAHTLRHPFY